MKNLATMALIGLGLMTIQSCAKESEICSCVDMSADISEGESKVNYDGSFRKKYLDEHKAESTKCEKLTASVSGDEAGRKKMLTDTKQCKRYAEYQEGLKKQIEHAEEMLKEEIRKINRK